MNLIAVFETRAGLRVRTCPGITAEPSAIGWIILMRIVNADGRSRVLLRMGLHRGTDRTVAESIQSVSVNGPGLACEQEWNPASFQGREGVR